MRGPSYKLKNSGIVVIYDYTKLPCTILTPHSTQSYSLREFQEYDCECKRNTVRIDG